MPEDSTYRMDEDSTYLEDGEQIELQHFIPTQHDVKIPTRKEARTARVQFLALCCSFFSLGWLVGGTGPLLPSIQKSYDVSEPNSFSTFLVHIYELYRLGTRQPLGYLLWDVRSVMFIRS